MANKIDTEIRLLGAEEIKRILAQLGITGEKAFQQVSDAVDRGNAKLQRYFSAIEQLSNSVQRVGEAGRNFGTAFNNLNTSMDKLGSAATFTAKRIAIVSGAISGAAVAAFAFVKSGTNAADEIIKQSQSVGLAVEAYQRLGFAAAQSGVDQQAFATGIARFSQEVQRAAQESRKALADFATGVAGSLDRANIKTIGFGNNTAATFKQIADVAAQVQQQLRARGIELPIGAITSKLQEMATGTAEARKQFDLLAGQTLASAQNALTKLGLEGDTSARAIQQLGLSVLNSKGEIRPLEELLGDLADRFAKMPDGIQKTALAAQLFGRNAGPRMIPLLNQGRGAIKALGDEFERMGLIVTKQQAQIAEAMNDSLSFLGTVVGGVRNQLALLFAPSITRAADVFRETIARNWQELRKFGQEAARVFDSVVNDILLLAQGRSFEVDNKWLVDLLDGITELGETIQKAVVNIILPAFAALIKALDIVAKAFNSVFGTDITGKQILAAVAIGKLIGLFSLVGATAGVALRAIIALGSGLILLGANFNLLVSIVRALGVTLAAVASGPGLLIAAVIAGAAIAIIQNWSRVRDLFSGMFSLFSDLANEFLKLNGVVQGLIVLLAGALLRALGLVRIGTLLAFGPIIAGIATAISLVEQRLDQLQGKASTLGSTFQGEYQKVIDSGQSLIRSIDGTTEALGNAAPAAQQYKRGIHDVQTELAQIGRRSVPGISDAPVAFKKAQDSAKQFGTEISNVRQRIDETFAALQQTPQLTAQESILSPFVRIVELFREQIERTKLLVQDLKKQLGELFVSSASASEGTEPGVSSNLFGIDLTAAEAQLQQLNAAVQNTWSGIIAAFSNGATQVNGIFTGLLNSLVASAQGIAPRIGQTFAGIAQAIAQSLTSIPQLFQSMSNQVVVIVQDMATRVEALVRQTLERLRALQQAASTANANTGGGGGFASGGYTGNIGTTRIAGVVHGGEYVQPARVVARPGVFDFMEVLRRTGDLRATIDRFTRGFSLGGFVDNLNASLAFAAPSSLPRFQTGGLVPAMSGGRHHGSVDLTLGGPGGRQTFRVYAPDATAEALTKFATLERMRSTGSPSWER